MQSLQKVTSEFIETEDRIRLSALTTEDKAVAFWMTQRLLIRLVTHLSKQIEMGSPQSGNAPKTEEASHSDRDIETNRESFAAESPVKIEKNIINLFLAIPSRFELPISSLTGRRVRPLHHGTLSQN